MFIVKVPGINGLGKTKGCEKAGNAVLSALKEIYSNEQGKIVDRGLLDLEEIHLDNSNVALSNELIYKNCFEIFEKKPKTIFLGGDHSISYSVCSAFLDFCKKDGKSPCLVVFDAHADLMAPMENPTHEEWLRALIEKGFPPENILIVGARNLERQERIFLDQHKLKLLSMNFLNEDLHDSCDTIMEFANGKELYVSIDIDVVDPAFAPATGYCEPGGLTSRQLLYIISRVAKMKNLRAVDIVEINPEKDYNNMTVKLGAKLLAELL